MGDRGTLAGGFGSVQGATAVVTGAASGIGYALTEALLGAGARVVMADVEPGALQVAAEGAARLGEVLPVVTDVRDASAVEELADRAADALGVVQLVFANAGVSVSGATWDMTPDDWAWILGVNTLGVAHTVRSFVPRLLASGARGHVCITASVAGYMNQPGFGAYNASKHAVVAIAESLAADLREAGHPIGVTLLAPWFVRTRLAQAGRNRPADLADATPVTDFMRDVSARLGTWGDTTQQPDEVAALALDAVANGQFAVFPFAPSRAAVRDRIDAVLAGGIMDFYLPS
jgi:NAD(P)-dependent dehydrogenase (short-subunit alcohol dehydrogenase family)